VRQHRGSSADRHALHGHDDRIFEPDECIHQAGLRRFAPPGRILEKIPDVVAGGEVPSSAVPEDDTGFFVFGGLVEDIRQARVHCASQGVLPLGAIEFDPQNAVG
jgi:hypothetical protein